MKIDKTKLSIIIITIIILIIAIIAFNINKTVDKNNKPSKPTTPTGKDLLDQGNGAYYRASSTDPDGDKISYGWDWNGDNIVDEWTEWFNESRTIARISHIWEDHGIFELKVKTKDTKGAESPWSETLTITVNLVPKDPLTPTLTGPTELNVNETATFYTHTTVPDNLPVRYYIMWGDSTYNKTALYPSGTMVNATHKWTEPGDYTIVCEAENEYFMRSHEALFNITIK